MKVLHLILSIALGAMLSSCGRTNHAEELEKQIKNMGGASAELGSVEYTISKIIAVDHDVFYKIGERKVLFSSLSTMKAGVDLSSFCADSVDVKKESIDIRLPKAKVLAFSMPPENIKMEYSKTGKLRSEFSAEERNEILKQGQEAILKDAEKIGILKDAEANVRTIFESLLAGANFKEINITFN
jgi:hypothetical protein